MLHSRVVKRTETNSTAEDNQTCNCAIPTGHLWYVNPAPTWLVRLREQPDVASLAFMYGSLIFFNIMFRAFWRGSINVFSIIFTLIFLAPIAFFHLRKRSREAKFHHEQIAVNLLNRKQKESTLRWAAQHDCQLLRYAAAKVPETPTESVDALVFDSDPHVAWAAYQHPNVSTRARTLAVTTAISDPGDLSKKHQFKFVFEKQHALCSRCQEYKKVVKSGFLEDAVCKECHQIQQDAELSLTHSVLK